MAQYTWIVRVSPTLSAIVGPCSSHDLHALLKSWGYVRTDRFGDTYTVDVTRIWQTYR